MTTQTPVIYNLEPIGVNGAFEAVERVPFCSTACRSDYYKNIVGNHVAYGSDAEGLEGEVCTQCAKQIQA